MPIQNVGDALLQLLNEVLLFLPRLVTFAVLLLVGYLIARVVCAVFRRGLHFVRFDALADRAGISRALSQAGTTLDAARVLAGLVFWWIFLIFIELAVNSLGLSEITSFINGLLVYLPNVFAAILILLAGLLIASVAAGVVRGATGEAGLSTGPLLASITRWAILLFAALAALTQLHIAQNMIFILFAALVGMLALAGGLALGLGGVETARNLIAGQALGHRLHKGQQVQIGKQAGLVVRHDLSSTVLETSSGQVAIPHASLAHETLIILSGNGIRQPASSPAQQTAAPGAGA